MRKDFQEHLLRTHGQNQRRVGSRVGSGMAGLRGVVGGKM